MGGGGQSQSGEKKTTANISLTMVQRDQLLEIADAQRVSRSVLVREVIDRYLVTEGEGR